MPRLKTSFFSAASIFRNLSDPKLFGMLTTGWHLSSGDPHKDGRDGCCQDRRWLLLVRRGCDCCGPKAVHWGAPCSYIYLLVVIYPEHIQMIFTTLCKMVKTSHQEIDLLVVIYSLSNGFKLSEHVRTMFDFRCWPGAITNVNSGTSTMKWRRCCWTKTPPTKHRLRHAGRRIWKWWWLLMMILEEFQGSTTPHDQGFLKIRICPFNIFVTR